MNVPSGVMMAILHMSEGNPGAATCLMGMVGGHVMDAVAGLTILPVLEEYKIKGTDIYVLWSDLAGKDYNLMAHLCKVVPKDVLIEASAQQDYSGRAMIEKYAATFNPLDHM